jgi:hypothetical protein
MWIFNLSQRFDSHVKSLSFSPIEVSKIEMLSDLTLIGSHLNGVGTSGCLQTCFYAEADDSQKCNAGGGLQDHGEFIQVVSLPVQNAKVNSNLSLLVAVNPMISPYFQSQEYIYNPNNASMAAGIRFIICWWFDTQASRYLQS